MKNPFRSYRVNTPYDFYPEWEVASINQKASDWLIKEIQYLVDQKQIDTGAEIPILLAPAGYGKSHLFARIFYQLEQEIIFISIPQIENPERIEEDIRWNLVETLFTKDKQGLLLIETILFNFSNSKENIESLLKKLKNPKNFHTAQKFAQTTIKKFPEIKQDVLYALALAWSSEQDNIRIWLRGEELADIDRLALGNNPPSIIDILKALKVLTYYKPPIVFAIDQIETLLEYQQGINNFKNIMMNLLHNIPGYMGIISCLESAWESAFMQKGFESFQQRSKTLILKDLNEQQALELISKRLQNWSEYNQEKPYYPFDEQDIISFVQNNKVNARALIRRCANAFEEWQDNNTQAIYLNDKKLEETTVSLEEQFIALWQENLKTTQEQNPENIQEDRIMRALEEIFIFLQETNNTIQKIQKILIHETKSGRLQAIAITIEEKQVLISFTQARNAKTINALYTKLQEKNIHPVIGIVFIYPNHPLSATNRAILEQDEEKGHVKALFFNKKIEIFFVLMNYLSLLDKVQAQDIVLGDKNIYKQDYIKLIQQSKVLENFELYTMALLDWPHWKFDYTESKPIEKKENIIKAKIPESADSQAWAENMLHNTLEILAVFNIKAKDQGYILGSRFVRLKILPIGNTKVNSIRNRAEEIKIHLGLAQIPLIASQAGFISIDIQRPKAETIYLENVLPANLKPNQAIFTVGTEVSGEIHSLDFAKSNTCHLLVAGTTGSGKSEFLKAMIAGLAAHLSEQDIQFILIDPKRVTFNFPGKSPYFYHPVAFDHEEALLRIEECAALTEERYAILQSLHIENIAQLPEEKRKQHPRILLIMDEFADLILDKESKKAFETPLKRMAAKARAAGIHLILATQRPEQHVVAPVLRSNLPARVCLRVASEGDSKIVLNNNPLGAYLLGNGDLLLDEGSGSSVRLQSPYVEKKKLYSYLKIK